MVNLLLLSWTIFSWGFKHSTPLLLKMWSAHQQHQASPESLLEMLNFRSHPRSTELLSRFLARSPRDLSAHQSIGNMFYWCWLPLPTGNVSTSYIQCSVFYQLPTHVSSCLLNIYKIGMANSAWPTELLLLSSSAAHLPAFLLSGAGPSSPSAGTQTPLCPVLLHSISQVLLRFFVLFFKISYLFLSSSFLLHLP